MMGMKVIKGNSEVFKKLDALWKKVALNQSDEQSGINKIKNKAK